MVQSVEARKAWHRARARERRRRAALEQPEAAARLARHLEAFLGDRPAGCIAGYWPQGMEIDPRPALERLAQKGWRLALPVVEAAQRPLLFRQWRPGDPLKQGVFCREPMECAPLCDPDILLTPLLAFDRLGRRLGQGGGFYDRTLAARPGVLAIGVAFAAQACPDDAQDSLSLVPVGPYDRPLSAIVTEQGCRRFL